MTQRIQLLDEWSLVWTEQRKDRYIKQKSTIYIPHMFLATEMRRQRQLVKKPILLLLVIAVWATWAIVSLLLRLVSEAV